ncbi:MAG: hypothetical protein D6682_02495 [Zetaproteobacteria bacterium]|nr:MAG: hypothetical protein D6682_02495 [Zetaproteobacteria bacterium]
MTRKLPCSCLAFTLFTAIFWLPGLFPGAPMIAFLFILIAVVAHFTTPALFALIQIGGGGSFVTPVALISSAGVAALNRFDPTVTLIYLLFYAVLPAMAANILRRHGGLARSGEVLAVAIFCAVTAALALGAALHGDGSLQKYTRMLMAPMFAPIEGRGGDAVEEVEASLALAMPGLVAGGLWSIWWGGLLGARWLAMRYGFYHDSCFSWYYVRFQPRLALLMLLALVPANMAGGNLQFVAIALSLLLAALFAVQGVAVAHLWLKERQLNVLLAGMYIFLFFWSLAIIPFVVIGLLDTWFDFRRGAPPEEGV